MGKYPGSITKAIWERDGGRCVYCGNHAEQIDHVVPTSRGGPNIKANKVCVCRACNAHKYNKLEQDALTRAIFWLLQHDEDMSWLDNI